MYGCRYINIMLTHMLILIRGQFKYFQFDYFHRELIVNSFLGKSYEKFIFYGIYFNSSAKIKQQILFTCVV